jgi:hypothetical protein
MHETHYARRNAIPLGIVVACAIAGAVFSPGLFPELPIWRPIVGGLCLGSFSGLCAVCHQLLE